MRDVVLLIDIGSTFTKVTAVDIKNECILARARSFTTVSTDINNGLNDAVIQLKKQIGEFNITKRLAASSAAGGLKMVSIGLVPELTVKAAKMAALSAGAKLMKAYSYELCEDEADEIEKLKPDIILLSGGTDGGNSSVILNNAQIIANISINTPVVIAGNKKAARKCEKILTESGKRVIVTENVMPEFNVLNIIPAQNAIREIFLERIIRAKGITQVEGLIEGIIMPTPSAVMQAAQLLAKGTITEKGIGDLLLVDMGGATTDVYSVCEGKPSTDGVVLKGLPEPFSKRTVEGDLGARYSAESVIEAYGMDNFLYKSKLTQEFVDEYLLKIKEDPSIIEKDGNGEIFDRTVAKCAVEMAVKRHSGILEKNYTMNGLIFVQNGKDLSQVNTVIGTGGPIIDAVHPQEIMSEALFNEKDPYSLRPKNAKLFIDKDYIYAAMGLLSNSYPDVALRILKSETIELK